MIEYRIDACDDERDTSAQDEGSLPLGGPDAAAVTMRSDTSADDEPARGCQDVASLPVTISHFARANDKFPRQEQVRWGELITRLRKHRRRVEKGGPLFSPVFTWEPLFRQWPGTVEAKRDPGDIASVDCGTRSRTVVERGTDKARFSCAHLRVTVDVETGDWPSLADRDLVRLTLYLAWAGHTCDCFRACWEDMVGGRKFGRAAAIATWRWLERGIGCFNVYPMWFERVPQGPDSRRRGEVVNDGTCSDWRGAQRLLRAWRRATKAQWARSVVGGMRTDYPVYTLDEYLGLDDAPTEHATPIPPARRGRPQPEAAP